MVIFIFYLILCMYGCILVFIILCVECSKWIYVRYFFVSGGLTDRPPHAPLP
jgi:hypothetical protein